MTARDTVMPQVKVAFLLDDDKGNKNPVEPEQKAKAKQEEKHKGHRHAGDVP